MKINYSRFPIVLLLVLLFTSCLNNNQIGNYQTFNGLFGSIVYESGVKLFRMDMDGTLLYSQSLAQLNVGDRYIASVSINYDNQSSDLKYVAATFNQLSKFSKKTVFDIDAIAKDTFKNDPIINFTYAYLINVNSELLFTTQVYFFASNPFHSFNLVKNSLVASDTLKLELRHNNKQDGELTNSFSDLYSFTLNQYLDGVIKGQSKVIEISYKTTPTLRKQFITYTP
ncbi:MAG: NigD-like C-terminal domain-containing protein [Bacteroidales bacterium]